MRDGDVYVTNNPWQGTGHLNDFTVVTPTFLDGRPVALFAATSRNLPNLPLVFAAERILADPALKGWQQEPEVSFGVGMERWYFSE